MFPLLFRFSQEYSQLHGYIASIVCVWGIATNIANIVVLTQKKMLSSTNMILTWLAVADLMTMASYFPVSLHFYIMKDPQLAFPASRSKYWLLFMMFHVNFAMVCHTIAIWLTITLAIFRYLYICYPTQGTTLCSLKRAKLTILAVYLCTAVICIPNYLLTAMTEMPIETKHYVWNTTTGNCSVLTEFHFMAYNFLGYDQLSVILNDLNYWIQALLIKLIPCFLLTILTILLIHAMHNANKRRMKLKSQGKKDESDRAREHNRTTAMLLAIVALFLLTELPQGILTMCSIFIAWFFNNIYVPLGDLLDIMALLNNSINFVLYCSMSRQFRDTFTEIFCSCCPEKRPGWLKVKAFHVKSGNTTNSTSV